MTDTQQTMLSAVTTWFHVFNAMIEDGDMARMGPYAYVTYNVIKSHTNYATGSAFPGVDQIVRKAGISKSKVLDSLKVLQQMGYITIARRGRHNVYTLREQIAIHDEQGQPQALASWDYLPQMVRDAVNDLKNVLVTGNLGAAQTVHIERLVLNINHGHHQTNFNLAAALDDPELRQTVKQIIADARAEEVAGQF
jgi:DNA-binding transcriptional MocR family regulator